MTNHSIQTCLGHRQGSTPAEEGEVPGPEVEGSYPASSIVPEVRFHVAHKLPATTPHDSTAQYRTSVLFKVLSDKAAH